MSVDPFAAYAAQNAAPETTEENNTVTDTNVTPPRPAVVADAEGKVVVTLKAGTGFDSPWIVIHAASVEDAADQLSAVDALTKLMDLTASAAKHFASKHSPAPVGRQSASAPSSAPPAGATEAPGGRTETCQHGQMVYKSGISKAGKPYKMFACPERDRNAQCPPVWA